MFKIDASRWQTASFLDSSPFMFYL